MSKENTARYTRWRSRLLSPSFMLYYSHALATWGDRMWQYATAMFLIALTPGSLRLTAIYGFLSGGAILLFGVFVGRWVDDENRLKVATRSLIIQNVFVSLAATVVTLLIVFGDVIVTSFALAGQALVIYLAIVADLASVARQISIERDWIVAMCDDSASLTSMSALLRRIDLTAKILAPAVTGLVMTSSSIATGAVCVAVWNVASVFVEYALLRKIYERVPALAERKSAKRGGCAKDDETAPLLRRSKIRRMKYDVINRRDGEGLLNDIVFLANVAPPESTPATSGDQRPSKLLRFPLQLCVSLVRGWETYFNQTVLLAGLALACLYMTVLGFDSVTAGFAKSEGLNEAAIGLILAGGAVFGIVGTLVFPRLRARVGLRRTGLIAFAVDIGCLLLCVGSIFAPGSPFAPTVPTAVGGGEPVVWGGNATRLGPAPGGNATGGEMGGEDGREWTSIALLMTGIVVSRIALWVIDLTVTQLLLEVPAESERGTVNGAQKSMNALMDQLKFLFVVALPWPQTFGILILASFSFVVVGGCLFIAYTRKATAMVQRNGRGDSARDLAAVGD